MLWMLKYEMKDMMSRVVILAVPCSCCSFTFFCVFFCTALMIFFRVRVRPSAPPHPDSHVTRILPTWQCTHTYYTPAQPNHFLRNKLDDPVRNMAIAYDRESRCGLHFFFITGSGDLLIFEISKMTAIVWSAIVMYARRVVTAVATAVATSR
ncbi:hypothetical protein BGY98DRAFT_430355 [Russula aff. rugulosa BPL654]|nr:hypothetical protein BGY98DRAFT_430355 [Russula aff. rugulosa BPL654]